VRRQVGRIETSAADGRYLGEITEAVEDIKGAESYWG
jgi:hypothetical protein